MWGGVIWPTVAPAQTCPEMLPVNVQCTDSDGNVTIEASDVNIVTSGSNAYGISDTHRGTGDLNLTVKGGDVTTSGPVAHGIFGWKPSGNGDITIEVSNVDIETSGGDTNDDGSGIYGVHQGTGDVTIEASGVDITTRGTNAHAIQGWITDTGSGDVRIEASNMDIETSGWQGLGIFGWNQGQDTGDVTIEVSDVDITTGSPRGRGIYGNNQTAGDVTIDASNVSITTTATTSNSVAYGMFGLGNGDVHLAFKGGDITTSGPDAHGIYGRIRQAGNGDITIEVSNVDIETSGSEAYGIYGHHQGAGDMDIEVSGVTIASVDHGIYGLNQGSSGKVRIKVIGGSITSSTGHGITAINENDNNEILVNGRVIGGGTGTLAGVHMTGDGTVTIGSNGFLGSGHSLIADRVAIHSVNGDLYVNLESNDYEPWELLGGKIVKSGDGTTTLAVNGVDLYRDAVIPDIWAPSGFHEVRLNEITLNGLDFSEEEAWLNRYGVNAGLYEALPGGIRRIHMVPCRFSSNRRLAVDLCGGRGKYTPGRADTGMGYTYDQRALQAHLQIPLSDQFMGWLGGRLVHGEAKVTTVRGQGQLKVRGPGLYGGVHLESDNDLYGQARFSYSRYDAELSAWASGEDDVRPITANADAKAYSLEIEAGRHFTLGNGMQLTGRGWYHLAGTSVDSFRDSVSTSVSAKDRQAKVGLGLDAVRERELVRNQSFLVLRGGVGLEHVLSEDSTASTVGTMVGSMSKDNRLLVDVGGEYRKGNFEVHGEVFAHGLASDDTIFGLRVGMNWSF